MVPLIFVTVVLVIIYLFAASSFTGLTLSRFTGSDPAALQAISLSIPTLYLAAAFGSIRRHHVILKFAGIASSVAMGFLNFASLAAILCWPISWLLSLTGMPADRAAMAWTLYGCSVPIAVLGLVNAFTLRVTQYAISLPNLPGAWDGRRIAVVSDIHVGNIFGTRFVQQIVDRLGELKPAALFICGDLFDGPVVDVAKSVEPWANFSAPAGTYFVTGNHEEIRNRAPYLTELSNVGVTVLNNQKVIVDGVQIIGIHDAEAHRHTLFPELLGRAGIDRRQCSILLVHRPRRLDVAEKAGISLQVSGHTHAGQFPPFGLLVRLIYGRFGYGHQYHGSLQVVTSSGAGTGGPPFRIGTRSEIVVITLRAVKLGGPT